MSRQVAGEPWMTDARRERDGRFVQRHPTIVKEGGEHVPVSDAAYGCDGHDRLGLRSRCLGCGRTRNEIELDAG